MKNHNIPTICIVGRPNVGKSSLYNCLFGKRRAVVLEQSGTTRDRSETIISLDENRKVKLVDTGGYVEGDKDTISMQVKGQILRAMEEASIIVLVVDTQSGIDPADKEIAALLRKFSKQIILVANKADNDKLKNDAMEFYQLGFGEPVDISCLHRRGVRKFRSILADLVDVQEEESEESKYKKIAIIGRPNVGKSSFVNCLIKAERVIVSDIPGTTRDSIDTHFSYGDDEYILIDTAGMRHKRKIKAPVDFFSIMRSKEAIKRADVVVMILDAADGATRDDMGILDFVEENGKACVVVVNKWDLAREVEDVSKDDYKKHLFDTSEKLTKFPLHFISSKTGERVINVLSIINMLDTNLDTEVSTPFLNKIFDKNDPSNISIPRSKRRPNFLYAVQSRRRPVEFKFFVNEPSRVLPVHKSFIENKLRDNIDLLGIPIKILIRKSRKERE